VNHSKEFVNSHGDNTNKMEGQWRQTKVKLPPFGVRKHHFSSYLAESMWRYIHKKEDLFQVFLNDVKKVYATSLLILFMAFSFKILEFILTWPVVYCNSLVCKYISLI